ncbi:hypothetical protein MHPYR_600004 [uncultured Mycobacterium sp.]|uniref:Uncharacterized protein n=1 Tax=uncultured Mycobacterium sp. TaxID=171292 RepID=A0A1Y5PMY3_9MYCO|nr:hypothetical protein MHPYR_600004 [uncultured Mycobacterium sp.]
MALVDNRKLLADGMGNPFGYGLRYVPKDCRLGQVTEASRLPATQHKRTCMQGWQRSPLIHESRANLLVAFRSLVAPTEDRNVVLGKSPQNASCVISMKPLTTGAIQI